MKNCFFSHRSVEACGYISLIRWQSPSHYCQHLSLTLAAAKDCGIERAQGASSAISISFKSFRPQPPKGSTLTFIESLLSCSTLQYTDSVFVDIDGYQSALQRPHLLSSRVTETRQHLLEQQRNMSVESKNDLADTYALPRHNAETQRYAKTKVTAARLPSTPC